MPDFMENIAYEATQVGALYAFAISYGILFISAAIGLFFLRYQFKIGRSVYLFLMMTLYFLASLSSTLALLTHDAVNNSYLTLVVAGMYGSMIPVGVLSGLIAAARSMDAFGTRNKWILHFIPLISLALLFWPPQEKRPFTGGRFAKVVSLVILSLIMSVSAGGANWYVSTLLDQQMKEIAGDEQMDSESAEAAIEQYGLENYLQVSVKFLQLPMQINETMTVVDAWADGSTIHYTYSVNVSEPISLQDYQSQIQQGWCEIDEFKTLINAGATIEGQFVLQDSQQSTEVRIDQATCQP